MMCTVEINVACVSLLGVYFKLPRSLVCCEVYTKYILSRGSQLRQFVHITKNGIPQTTIPDCLALFLAVSTRRYPRLRESGGTLHTKKSG